MKLFTLTQPQQITCVTVAGLGFVTTIVASLLGQLLIAFVACGIACAAGYLWRLHRKNHPDTANELMVEWSVAQRPAPRDVVDRNRGR